MEGAGQEEGGRLEKEVAAEPSSEGTARVEVVRPRLVYKIQHCNEDMILDRVAPQLGWREDKGCSYWRVVDNHVNVLAWLDVGQSSSQWVDAERVL